MKKTAACNNLLRQSRTTTNTLLYLDRFLKFDGTCGINEESTFRLGMRITVRSHDCGRIATARTRYDLIHKSVTKMFAIFANVRNIARVILSVERSANGE